MGLLGYITLTFGETMKNTILLLAALICLPMTAPAVCPDFLETGLISQASTPTIDVVVGSDVDAKCFSSISFMFQADHDGAVTVWVYGANDPNFEDEVRVVTWSTYEKRTEDVELPRNPVNVYYDSRWFLEHAPATYGYYRVKVQDFPGNSGTLLLHIIAKR
jgi:hypothetical protein